MARAERSEPDDPDGLMNDQEMPTADGQMASNTSEETVPPGAARAEEPRWGADSGSGGPGVSGHAAPAGEADDRGTPTRTSTDTDTNIGTNTNDPTDETSVPGDAGAAGDIE